jgi:hypothetical protein
VWLTGHHVDVRCAHVAHACSAVQATSNDRKKGLRGRFANYVPPVLEQLGTVEVEHKARGNRMRAR